MKKFLFSILFLLTGEFTSFAQTATLSHADSLDALLVRRDISADDIFDQLVNTPGLVPQNATDADYTIIETRLDKRASNKDSINDAYLLARFKSYRYCKQKNIGKALLEVDNFYRQIKSLNNDDFLSKTYNMYISVYNQFELREEVLKYTRLLNAILKKNASPERIVDLNANLSWVFYQVGRENNDTVALDSSAYYRMTKIKYLESHPELHNIPLEAYKTYIMAIIQLKRYPEVLTVAHKAFNLCLDQAKKADLTKGNIEYNANYYKKMLTYMAVAHSRMGNRDSAFYYLNNDLVFEHEKTARNIFYQPKNSYLGFDELFERVRIHAMFNEEMEATELLDRAIFSDDKITDPEMHVLLCNLGGAIYEKVGRYKEAAYCFHIAKESNDSLNEERNLLQKEADKTNLTIQIESAKAEEKAIQEKKDLRQRVVRNSIAAVLAGSLIFLTVVYRQRNKIAKGKQRSDELLLNILPAETAEELKNTGTTTAKDFSEVTVLFTDFKNFTQMSEQLTAQELVNEINYCYSAFDHIITKFDIEKIKTIGDSYMCAGGLPMPNKTHAVDTVKAALEIRDFMETEKQKRITANLPFFEIRIGCNTGPVIAGIVGIKKFAYDIWGVTVNVASRMESSGEAGKVNISGSTYELIKDKFKCEHRGKIEAKNKGEIDMYFVENA